jgi:hypothetical protein
VLVGRQLLIMASIQGSYVDRTLTPSPPVALIPALIVIWDRRENGLALACLKRRWPIFEPIRIAGNPVPAIAKGANRARRRLAERRFSRVGAPCQRGDAAVRIGNDTGRLVIGVNGLPHGNQNGEGGDCPRGVHLHYPCVFNARPPPSLKPHRRALLSFPRRPSLAAAVLNLRRNHRPPARERDGAQRPGRR